MSDETIEADFIEFEFGDVEKATRAERAFPLYASLGTSIAIRTSLVDELGDTIRAKLTEMGLEWTEAPSGLTEEDMWPRWPEDEASDDEDEDDAEAPGPSF